MLKDIIEIMPQFDVISFDIFDTLLLRPYVYPSDLFWKIEFDENAKGFAVDRMKAERKAQIRIRANGGAEATLDDIYSEMPQWSRLKEKELLAEEKCLVANPEVVEIFNYAKTHGKKILVVSDMYLSADFLKAVLLEKGIGGWDDFYVSSEYQAQKWTGDLYDKILAEISCPPEKILHIGDNLGADVYMANRKGIVSYGYQAVLAKFYDECPFVKTFIESDCSVAKRLFVGALALGWHLYKCAHSNWTYWNRMGALFAGPLCYEYARYIACDAKSRNIHRLLFVARDGYIVKKIFNQIYPDVRTDYLFVSRAMMNLATSYNGLTDASKTYRLQHRLEALLASTDDQLVIGEIKKCIESGVISERVNGLIAKQTAQRMIDVKLYLDSKGIKPQETGLVDGTTKYFTTEKVVSEALGAGIHSYYWLSFTPSKCGASIMWPSFDDVDPRYHDFCEYLISAPHPPVDSVKAGMPVYKGNLSFFERYKIEHCEDVEAGATGVVGILDRFGVKVSQEMWADWVESFFDNQTSEDYESLTFARMTMSTDHSGGYVSVVKPRWSVRRIRVCGKTLLGVRIERHGCNYYRTILLFGKWKLISIRKWWR